MIEQSVHEELLFHEQQAHDTMKSGYELGVIDTKTKLLSECIICLDPKEYMKLKKHLDKNWESPQYGRK